MTYAEIIALGSLCLNIIVAMAGLTWGIARVRNAIAQEIDEHREKLDDDIHGLRMNTGNVITAVREKITEVELFARDTFVRRDSFYKTMEMIGNDMKVQFEKIDHRLERMEAKIDSKA